MKHDLIIWNAEVVDGTGAPRYRADITVDGGRITAIGKADDDAVTHIVGTGLVVCPGFIDLHTHYDAQVLWDPTCSPSPLHGVTTVLGGNCGFTIAPLDDGHVDYVRRMMARVEGIPLESLEAGPEWNWRGFGEWLDRIEGKLGVNAGFLVGHSTLRRVVMGDAAVGDEATGEQIARMVELARAAMNEGALGFSSSLGEAHTDGDGNPVPSRFATHDEILALCTAVRDCEGTTLEFISAMGELPQARIELMTQMSLAANRPLNWNLLGSLSPTPVFEQQLSSCDHAREHGAHVVALALPDLMRMRASKVIDDMPGWREIVDLPADERRRAATDPSVRARLKEGAIEAAKRGLGAVTNWELVEIAEGLDGISGRSVADVARERSADPIDILIDVVLPERLPLSMVFPSLVPNLGVSEESWQVRKQVWHDDRVVLGGSDAGAHTNLLCHANYPTVVLGEMVRERAIFTLEDAVRRMTQVPAQLYGLRDRGELRVGAYADMVVFDPASVASEPAVARFDLPAGGERLYAAAAGIHHVFVNGREIVQRGEFTGELAGQLLRSGRDTYTVTVPGGSI